jgi:shikimate dehydrogenase
MTTLVGLLGWPVAHSRSPAMHNAAFRALGLDWRYELVPVEPERFDEVVREMPGRGFAGANVTIPHKLRALAVADSATAVARAVGAANTLVFGSGLISADNTDVEGLLSALRERAPGAPGGMSALVLGAGGAGRAAAYALLTAGCARVAVWNRTPGRARDLAAELARTGGTAPEAVERPRGADFDLIVNATSVGMARPGGEGTEDGDAAAFKPLPLSADEFLDRQIVVDLVYRQDGTGLIRAARAHGLCCVDGFDVLVHQGAASFRLWTGREAPRETMSRAARDP